MQRGLLLYSNQVSSSDMIESILSIAKNTVTYCYTYPICFDNNEYIEGGKYTLDTLINLIRDNGGNIQETTIWGSGKHLNTENIPHTYEEFYNSDYDIILDCADFEYLSVYSKSTLFLMKVMKKLASPLINISIISDDIDFYF